jgi:hypothetical protein
MYVSNDSCGYVYSVEPQHEIVYFTRCTEPAVIQRSSLAVFLIELHAWGIVSAVLVQKIAHRAYDDGLRHPDIQMLKELGLSPHVAHLVRL